VSLHAVDMGLPQLAMHSAWETAGAADTAWGIKALGAFYRIPLAIEGADRAKIGEL
jgi:aspartyl aminopeptidase